MSKKGVQNNGTVLPVFYPQSLMPDRISDTFLRFQLKL
ncbi:hypothetical protein EFW57_01966 [Bacillus velezensis]|nr:hypothetical protein U471_13940 [Bacillus amyloliquefaciens CC178]KYC88321.1 hypothetical protein B4140_1498 [Bacillus amyloliquefaciens]RAP15380.1 hypothetical protein HS9_00707 [Bacillus velezensis]RUR99163.1 hypothetical protein EFW57_01966 [Bacillus velezensis]